MPRRRRPWRPVGLHWRLAGWVALVLVVGATLALGIGLMALVFISNRRGFDEPDRGGR